jgi:hypothetical protein
MFKFIYFIMSPTELKMQPTIHFRKKPDILISVASFFRKCSVDHLYTTFYVMYISCWVIQNDCGLMWIKYGNHVRNCDCLSRIELTFL